MKTVRLSSRQFQVEVRLAEVNHRWIASADTPDGPTLGMGHSPLAALVEALEPFSDAIDELLLTAPEELFER